MRLLDVNSTMTVAQAAILMLSPQKPTLMELSQELGLDVNLAKRAIYRLEGLELIDRTVIGRGGRSITQIAPTTQGQALISTL